MATWKSAAYDGRYLQLDISESVNVVGNSSTLSWTLTSTGGASTYYTIDTTTVTINGTTVYSKERTYWDDRVFPAKKGSVSGTITVAHDSNGSKTITVGFSTRLPEAVPRWSRRRRRGVASLASSWMTITSSRPSGASRRCGNEPTQAARHPA
mgnify:CR=1 FL=1